MLRVEAQDAQPALVRTAQSFQAFYGRCLAGAVGADHPENFTGTDFEGHSINRPDVAIELM
jgi:hypothetical protein